MDRRGILKGLGTIIGWPHGLRSRLFHPLSSFESTAGEHESPAQAPLSEHPSAHARDIRKLTQHFTGESEDISPWIFTPSGNIRSVSTSEHPGFVTVWHGDKGRDVKGLLNDPIKIDDFPIPWEFHLGFGQIVQKS